MSNFGTIARTIGFRFDDNGDLIDVKGDIVGYFGRGGRQERVLVKQASVYSDTFDEGLSSLKQKYPLAHVTFRVNGSSRIDG